MPTDEQIRVALAERAKFTELHESRNHVLAQRDQLCRELTALRKGLRCLALRDEETP